MKKLAIRASLIVSTLLLGVGTSASACTDVKVAAKDGTVIIARSLEFAENMKSNLRTSPRGRMFTTTAPDGHPGISWKSTYGYVFLDAFGMDKTVDGMNEQGLSYEALYLPRFAQYETVPNGADEKALPYVDLGDWVLSNFKTVDQVRVALSHLYVFAQTVPGMGSMIFPLHFAIYDASGKGIIVEYVKGQLHIYDNKLGIMTNSPEYPWHITNLNNYINLTATTPAPVIANGIKFGATGQGFGLLGLPGDYSPPSRFVKMAVLLKLALPAADAASAINLAEHLINNVDIISGVVRENQTGNVVTENTQWADFKDLTHKVFYYRTYDNMTLRSVSLAKLNFMPNAKRLKMPIDNGPYVQDATAQFLTTYQ